MSSQTNTDKELQAALESAREVINNPNSTDQEKCGASAAIGELAGEYIKAAQEYLDSH